MKIARTVKFKKAWKQLNEQDKKLARKAIENLANDVRYPSLRVKKIEGTEDVWEARASLSIRMTFKIGKDVITLRNIGQHDKTLKQL